MFIELVDIFGIGLANLCNTKKWKKNDEHKEYLNIYASFLKELAKQLAANVGIHRPRANLSR